MHARSAYLYKWDVGLYTQWLLQRDRGGTDWKGGHQIGVENGDHLWEAKVGQLVSLGLDFQPAGEWSPYK